MFVGLVVGVVSFSAWAAYRSASAAPVTGRDMIEPRAEPQARLILRIQGLAEVDPTGTPFLVPTGSTPSGMASPDVAGELEEPL